MKVEVVCSTCCTKIEPFKIQPLLDSSVTGPTCTPPPLAHSLGTLPSFYDACRQYAGCVLESVIVFVSIEMRYPSHPGSMYVLSI
jgi:hypothetical protein